MISFLRILSQIYIDEAIKKLATAPIDLPHNMKRLYPNSSFFNFFKIAPEHDKKLTDISEFLEAISRGNALTFATSTEIKATEIHLLRQVINKGESLLLIRPIPVQENDTGVILMLLMLD